MTPRKITFIILAIVALLVTLAFSSCSNKFYAKQCAKRFPIVESTKDSTAFIQGATIVTPSAPFVFNCDSAIKWLHDTTTLTHDSIKIKWLQSKGNVFIIPCPPSTNRVDTFLHLSSIIKKSTAELFLLQSSKDSLNKQCLKRDNKINEQSEKIAKQAKYIFHLRLLVGLIVAVFGIGIYFKIHKI